MRARNLWLLVAALLLLSAAARGEDLVAPDSAGAAAAVGVRVEDAWIEEALVAAGENRVELEAALARFDDDPDPRKRVAIRTLVANMPGRGYVITALKDAEGRELAYDPTGYPNFAAAREAIEALEREHGELSFDRSALVLDVETIGREALVRHVELAFEAWERVPAAHRVAFPAFLEHVLPYRGSEEPLDDWLDPLLRRYADVWQRADATPKSVYALINKEAHQRVRFDERYYLHPTDQGFTEMSRSGLGRCEDITNMITYGARSVGLATAADFTPAWGHRDNNHAWNVLLDADGRGSDPSNAHAAKVYRKTFAIQRDALRFRLPEGREAPNRFLASATVRDVTDQYGPTTDLDVALDEAAGEERFAYLCVFNGGRWVAVAWAPVEDGRAVFRHVGRDLLYLPAVHDGEALIPAAPPRLVEPDGTVVVLSGEGAEDAAYLAAVRPRQQSVDTGEVTPVSLLEAGARYLLQRWDGRAWQEVETFVASEGAPRQATLKADGLYWLVREESRRLERPFVLSEGRQRFR